MKFDTKFIVVSIFVQNLSMTFEDLSKIVDVWKTVVWFRSNRPDITAYTLETDNGLGIITKNPSSKSLSYSDKEIIEMTYQDFIQIGPGKLLGLKDAQEFMAENL